ncbi:MAG TPA: portal protein [Allosphingosinicella sp.]|nr:portal protein [Allosphingosinicella sp.]
MEQLQDEDLVKSDLLRQQEMEAERAPWEPMYRSVERLVDPISGGGFDPTSPGGLRGVDIFDPTAPEGLDRFDAALGAVTVPKNQRWHGLTVLDKDLARLPAVQRWQEHATDRLFACRYAPHVGAGVQFSQDRRQIGSYGTAPLLVDEWKGRGLFYNALHLSECFIDEDFRGRIDTIHRKFELSARQARQMFGEAALPPKIQKALEQERTCGEKFQFLHVVRPNERIERDRLDWRGKPIASRYIAVDEKSLVRNGGYHSMPIAVSRNSTSPRDKYGRSPAMKVLGTIKGVNEMAKTMIRAGHKAVDPALAFYDDGDISKLVTKPGGLNPGLVSPDGHLLVQPIPHGGNLPFGLDLLQGEREPIKTAFLEEFFKILTNPSDRMTATQVLEMVAKQGVLIQPFADRYETEKLGVMVERELDILMRAGQIDPMPPEMLEAGARPLVVMTNPLAKMARAQEASAFTRWVEIGVQAASAGRPDALDRVNFDKGMPDVGEVLGVRPSWVLSDDELVELRRARAAKEEADALGTVAPKVAGAALDLARANEIGMGMAA